MATSWPLLADGTKPSPPSGAAQAGGVTYQRRGPWEQPGNGLSVPCLLSWGVLRPYPTHVSTVAETTIARYSVLTPFCKIEGICHFLRYSSPVGVTDNAVRVPFGAESFYGMGRCGLPFNLRKF